jgi:phosphatidylinositol alpha-mannosyltransferase
MRVALVCPYDWSRPGGVRDHVAHLADHLRAAHQVAVFAPASGTVAEAHVHAVGGAVGVRYNRSVAPVALAPAAAFRLTSALRKFAPDLVHVHEPFAPLLGVVATSRAPHPVVGTFHAWSDHDRAYRAAAPVSSHLARRLDARIAVSPSAQQYAARVLRLPHAAFTVLPNGVDAARFACAEPLRELIDPERPLLLFVGRLEPRKGLDVAVRAFLRLRASDASVRLCVVGDGPERDRCQQMIPPSLRPDVLFVGRVAADDLPRYHASADLLVAPSTGGESFGVVLLEAMAAGLPVLASDIPGYRTVLHDGRQGRLVRPRDAFALADAAGALLASPRLRDAMAEQGRRTAAEYAWPVVGARIAALYEVVRARADSP